MTNVTEVDVDSVVNEAISRHKVAADNANIEVRTDAPSGLRVLGDETLLVTALANLVSNAIAYSPPGSPVSISRRRRGDNIEIAVTDRGIGIALEDQERVFERFFRGQGALARHRRQRPGPGHRQARRGQSQRHHRGVEQAGHRIDIHPVHSGGRGAGSGRR